MVFCISLWLEKSNRCPCLLVFELLRVGSHNCCTRWSFDYSRSSNNSIPQSFSHVPVKFESLKRLYRNWGTQKRFWVRRLLKFITRSIFSYKFGWIIRKFVVSTPFLIFVWARYERLWAPGFFFRFKLTLRGRTVILLLPRSHWVQTIFNVLNRLKKSQKLHEYSWILLECKSTIF